MRCHNVCAPQKKTIYFEASINLWGNCQLWMRPVSGSKMIIIFSSIRYFIPALIRYYQGKIGKKIQQKSLFCYRFWQHRTATDLTEPHLNLWMGSTDCWRETCFAAVDDPEWNAGSSRSSPSGPVRVFVCVRESIFQTLFIFIFNKISLWGQGFGIYY